MDKEEIGCLRFIIRPRQKFWKRLRDLFKPEDLAMEVEMTNVCFDDFKVYIDGILTLNKRRE